jgi:hypothetical protein
MNGQQNVKSGKSLENRKSPDIPLLFSTYFEQTVELAVVDIHRISMNYDTFYSGRPAQEGNSILPQYSRYKSFLLHLLGFDKLGSSCTESLLLNVKPNGVICQKAVCVVMRVINSDDTCVLVICAIREGKLKADWKGK